MAARSAACRAGAPAQAAHSRPGARRLAPPSRPACAPSPSHPAQSWPPRPCPRCRHPAPQTAGPPALHMQQGRECRRAAVLESGGEEQSKALCTLPAVPLARCTCVCAALALPLHIPRAAMPPRRLAPEGGLPATAMAPYRPATAVAAVPCTSSLNTHCRAEQEQEQRRANARPLDPEHASGSCWHIQRQLLSWHMPRKVPALPGAALNARESSGTAPAAARRARC